MTGNIVLWIGALTGAITGIGGLLVALRTSRASARKDEVEVLRGIIAELRAEVDTWKQKYEDLYAKYDDLCEWIRSLGFDPESRTRTRILQEGAGDD